MTVAPFRPNIEDERWFRANPAKPWRVRRLIGDAEPPSYDTVPGREPALAVFKTRHGILGVPAPIPYPDEVADPWMATGKGTMCRVRDYFAALQRCDVLVPDQEMDLPDQSEEYNQLLGRYPDRLVRESIYPPREAMPPELAEFFGRDDHLLRLTVLRQMYKALLRMAEDSPTASVVESSSAVDRMALGVRFVGGGRRVEKPTRALVDFLLRGNYPVRDDVPFVPPSGCYLIDVTDAPLRFPNFDDADTAFVHVTSYREPTFQDKKTWEALRGNLAGFADALARITATGAVGRNALPEDRDALNGVLTTLERAFALIEPCCGAQILRFGTLSLRGAIDTTIDEVDEIESWTDAFAYVNDNSEDVVQRDVGRLIYGLAYLRQVRVQAGKPEPAPIAPNPKRGEIYARQPRDSSIELPQYKILSGQHPTAAEPRREHLVEATTERREHTRTQRYGKGLTKTKTVTIKKNDNVKVWVRPDRDPNAPKRTRLRLNRAGVKALREEAEKKA